MSGRDIDDIALTMPCPACGAEADYWCVTYRPHTRPPGEVAVWLHSPRTNPVREAWSLGYHDGQGSALTGAARSLAAARQGEFWAKRDNVPVLTDDRIERWLERLAERWAR